jgi:hypothetical protein
MTKLVCTECKHENEAQRIYWHNCGAKLGRSALLETRPKEDRD